MNSTLKNIIPARFTGQQQPEQPREVVEQPPVPPRHAEAIDFFDRHHRLVDENSDLKFKLDVAIVENASLSQSIGILRGEIDALRRERSSLAQAMCELKIQMGIVASRSIDAARQSHAAQQSVADTIVKALEAVHKEMTRVGLAEVIAGTDDAPHADVADTVGARAVANELGTSDPA